MNSFKFIDLFAGIGGTRLAFESVGGKCVFTSEWDKFCQKTYEENFGETPHGDITSINAKTIPDHDVLLAGFPCQPFSTIGKRQGFKHTTQGTLFFDVSRILKYKRPKAFMLENVPGLKTHDGGQTYKIIKNVLANELDYWIFDDVLNSADYGVPQKRRRIYIIGFDKKIYLKKPNFKFPSPIQKKAYIGDYVEKNVEGYTISKHLQKSYLFKKDDGRPEIIDEHSKIQVKTLVASYHKIQRLTGTFIKGGKTGYRLLTKNECKAIMGFPTKFKIPVSRTQMYRQFGNTVVIPVVSKIAHSMTKVLFNKKGENR